MLGDLYPQQYLNYLLFRPILYKNIAMFQNKHILSLVFSSYAICISNHDYTF